MKEILIYEYPRNKASVSLHYCVPNQKNKRSKDDVLYLKWETQEKEVIGVGMRPDEALLIAEMLTKGVRLITESFNTSKPIKNYLIKHN